MAITPAGRPSRGLDAILGQQAPDLMASDAMLSNPRVQQYVLDSKFQGITQAVEQLGGVFATMSGSKDASERNSLITGIKTGIKEAWREAQYELAVSGTAMTMAGAIPGQRAPMASPTALATSGTTLTPPTPQRPSTASPVAPATSGITLTPGGIVVPPGQPLPPPQGRPRILPQDVPAGVDDITADVSRAPVSKYHPVSQMNYQQAKATGGSLKSIEAMAASKINDIGSKYTQGDDGNIIENATGRVLEGGEAKSAATSMARLGRLKTLTAPLMEGGGIGGALGGLTKFAGPVGAVIGAVSTVGAVSEKVQDMIQPYRQISNTGTFGGLKDLGSEWLSGISGFGGMGMGDARDQYRQVSEIGLTGDERSQAVGFMADTYSKFGMETADSIKLVQMATKDSGLSLDDLTKQLEAVGLAAVEAGGNASEAQKLFISNLANVTANITSSSPSAAYSTALGAVTSGLTGTTLEGLSVGGVLATDTGKLQAAAAEGVSPDVLSRRLSRTGVAGERQLAIATNTTIAWWLSNKLGITDEEQSVVRKSLADRHRGKWPNDIQTNEATQILTLAGIAPRIREQTIIDTARSVGILAADTATVDPLTMANAYPMVIFAILGRLDVAEPPAGRRVKPSDLTQANTSLSTSDLSTEMGYTDSLSVAHAAGQVDVLTRSGRAATEMGATEETANWTSAGGDPVKRYTDVVTKTGTRNMVLEALLDSEHIKESIAATFQVGAKGVSLNDLIDSPSLASKLLNPNMTVNTAGGEQVSLAEFSDYTGFVATDAGLAPGEGKGGNLVPSRGGGSAGSPAMLSKEEGPGGGSPAAIDLLDRSTPSGSSGGSTSSTSSSSSHHRVSIDISPKARRLLRIMDAQDGATSSDRSGVPAPGSRTPNDWRMGNGNN